MRTVALHAATPQSIRLLAVVAATCLMAASVQADSAAPLPPETLAKVLPAAWGDMTREATKTEAATIGVRSHRASVRVTAKRGSTDPFTARFEIVDEGANGARMYAMGAAYLTGDVRSDAEHSIKLPGGRRALVTPATADSMTIETQVAGRFLVQVSCSRATEAECVGAFGHWDFKAIEALPH
ncbi:MAG: hypothetical protein JSR18_09130 [Proteobacteria bacterium]|nr:hypothetical protein [Pseudomonadota bacterium]